MQADKAGVEHTTNSKHTATPAVNLENATAGGPEPGLQGSSRRGVGHQWKRAYGSDMPTLFGAGGEQDGVSALIQTFANRQKEDELALHGQGERTLDENRFQRSMANANSEFNFSQYKTGASYSENTTQYPGDQKVTLTEGLASGDFNVHVDPYAAIVDQTTQAMGAIYGGVYKLNGGNNTDGTVEKMGRNPFQHTKAKGDKDDASNMPIVTEEEATEDGYDIDYYYNDPYYEDGAEEAINENKETGLRRVNIRSSQKRQLERVGQSEDIMKAYQEANDAYAQTVKEHFKGAYRSQEDREETLERLRNPTSKYSSSQYGVNDVSRDTEKAYKGKRHHAPNKLNATLVGV